MSRTQHPYDTLIEAFVETRIPSDLAACYLWLAAALLTIYLPFVSTTFLRVLFGIPLILFIPGYTLIAALFPSAKDIEGIERVALSFGLSIAVVPLTGLALNYTPWGIRLDPILVCLSLFTICMCLAAQYRRAQLPEEERFAVPFAAIKSTLKEEFFPKDTSGTSRILSAVLLIAIVAAVATTVYVIVIPKEGEKFTEFFILGEKQKAADYPTQLLVGKNASLYFGIGNHEYRSINYTVETYMTNVTFNERTNTSTLNAMDPLDRIIIPVGNNETVVRPYTFSARSAGYNRIDFLLFNESVPEGSVTGMERINRSDRDLHLWVRVSNG